MIIRTQRLREKPEESRRHDKCRVASDDLLLETAHILRRVLKSSTGWMLKAPGLWDTARVLTWQKKHRQPAVKCGRLPQHLSLRLDAVAVIPLLVMFKACGLVLVDEKIIVPVIINKTYTEVNAWIKSDELTPVTRHGGSRAPGEPPAYSAVGRFACTPLTCWSSGITRRCRCRRRRDVGRPRSCSRSRRKARESR